MKRREEEDALPFKFNTGINAYKEKQKVREHLRDKVNTALASEAAVTSSAAFVIYGLRDVVDEASNRARRQALKERVDATHYTAAETDPTQTAQGRKDYLGSKVRAALVACAAADPVRDFSRCSCDSHNDFHGGPDAIVGSLVWR